MNLKKVIIVSVKYCLACIFLSLFINYFIGYFCDVNGSSMSPTLPDEDRIVISKVAYLFDEPERFDIIVFRIQGDLLIKRIVGLPGDHIAFFDNRLYVNGKPIDEPFLESEHEYVYTDDFLLSGKIPANQYFVLGDNRDESIDSRSFGLVPIESIEGKAIMRWFPNFTLNISSTTLAKD